MSTRKPMSYHAGHGFKIYSWLKMAIIAYQTGMIARDKGADPVDAIKTGVKAAGSWFMFVMYTLAMPLYWSAIPANYILHHMSANQNSRIGQISDHRLNVAVFAVGIPTLIFCAVCWLALYSKIKELIDSPSYANPYGLMYEAGRFFRRIPFLGAPGWLIGLLGFAAIIPFHLTLGL